MAFNPSSTWFIALEKENRVNDATQNQFAADVARDLVAQLAPEEMPLFRANSEAYFKNPEIVLKEHTGKDDMLGFGTGEVMSLLTPVAIAVSVEVVKFVTEEVKKSLKTESSGMISDLVKGIFKKYRPGVEEEEKAASAMLTVEQLQQVHKIAFAKARNLKLSEMRANRLADALLAELVTPG